MMLKIKMFGELSLKCGEKIIVDSGSRSNKVWLLLAYMFFYRKREITQNELIRLLWGNNEEIENPSNALKTMFHRARKLLDRFGNGIGSDIIVRQRGSNRFNNKIQCSVDCEEFEKLYNEGKASVTESEELACYKSAIEVYGINGDFLPKQNNEFWVISLSSYYHNMYVQIVKEMIDILKKNKNPEKIVEICSNAIKIEPYEESLYYDYMEALIKIGKSKRAAKIYNDMSCMFFEEFGIFPSEDIRALYREATSTINMCEMNISEVIEQIKESDKVNGAYFCDYDFFKILYRSQARALERNGDVINVCLLSVVGINDTELTRRSLNTCMANLDELIHVSLRRGDVVSKCSVSQYIIMLPHANYEDSCLVMERINKKFKRKFPHSPANLQYSIQPMKPVC
ncbi:MAG: hypothetical protein LKJ25_05350 [Clostridia bacterium]|jgi:DNA-binding SARP family transcriptional activator|nr:hypothetical protein [Clostridia bacterium]